MRNKSLLIGTLVLGLGALALAAAAIR
ncbi:MAG: hypothetical protein RL309_151, partial [Verrucomicrobiota bacterium]